MIVTFSISQSSASSKSGTSRCTSTPATTTNTSPEKTRAKNSWKRAYKTQRDRIEQLEVFINRFRYTATKAKQVQSRIKELEKIERIQIPEEEKTVHFSFPQPKPSGRIVAEFANVAKSYGERGVNEHKVFDKVNFMIERGERIALVGVNGAGKSTLIKLLAQQEKLTAGEYKLGHEVHLDYFAQDQYKELDPEARILDDLGELSGASTQTELRSLLGCFLFSGDDVFKRIGVLSGGERNRYALLKMLLHPANFLLLDEPTNHLDLRAKDVLLEALMKYTGTVVFVSHDRYFIDNLATRVFEIGDGKVEIYPGNYEDYLWRKQGGAARQTETISNELVGELSANRVVTGLSPAPQAPTNGNALKPEPADSKARRLNPIKRQQMEDRLHEIEEEIARAEAAIALCETQLQSFVSAEETQRQTQELARKKSDVQGLMKQWEELSETLESDL
jgi:ATP-binding cassette subfamily F protein 3